MWRDVTWPALIWHDTNVVFVFLSFFLFSEATNPSHPWLGDQKSMDVLRTIIGTVSVHVQKGGTMTTQEDVLECLRPFCADVTVSAAVKTTVLQLMEESFDLSGEDTFLLLFYQTDAIVSSTWNKKVAFSLGILYMKNYTFLPTRTHFPSGL